MTDSEQKIPNVATITCPDCGRTSHHPQDVAQGYCSACHWWTSDPVLCQVRPESDLAHDQAHEFGRRIAQLMKEREGLSDG